MPVQNIPAALSHQSLPLRDIHLPEAISWWPPAPGWWLVIATIIGVLVIYYTVKKIRYRRRLKRVTKDAFETLKQQYLDNHDKRQLACNLSILLRRASISFYPRHDTAGLTGKDWLNYLDSTLPNSATTRFNSKLGQVLLTAPYMKNNASMPNDNTRHTAPDYDADTLLKLCQQWLRAQPVKKARQVHPQNHQQKMTPPGPASSSAGQLP